MFVGGVAEVEIIIFFSSYMDKYEYWGCHLWGCSWEAKHLEEDFETVPGGGAGDFADSVYPVHHLLYIESVAMVIQLLAVWYPPTSVPTSWFLSWIYLSNGWRCARQHLELKVLI
jgi:hypothetical protein